MEQIKRLPNGPKARATFSPDEMARRLAAPAASGADTWHGLLRQTLP